MNYPAKYAILEHEEMIAQTGAGMLEVFDQAIGDTFKTQFLNSVRNTVWNCLQQKSLRPTEDWIKELQNMSLLNMLGFLYGGFRVGQNVINYWKQ